MLVLTRKINEVIQIGDNITVTILKVRGQIVRVGIDAPKNVRILRSELSETSTEKDSQSDAVTETVGASSGSSSAVEHSSSCSNSDSSTRACFSPRERASCSTNRLADYVTDNVVTPVRRPLARAVRRSRNV